MKEVFRGFVLGVLLSALRWVDGGLLSFPIPATPRYATLGAVVALTGLIVGLAGLPRSRARGTQADAVLSLLGVLVGFAAHGLLIPDARSSVVSIVPVVVILAVITLIQRRGSSKPPAGSWESSDGGPGDETPEDWSPGPLGLVGIVLAGSGAAVALEGAARWVRLMSDGTREDGTGFALAFLLTMLIGAVSFGGLVGGRALRGLALPVGLTALAASALASLNVLGRIASPRGLFRYFQHPVIHATGIESTQHGMLGYVLLIGASCFVVPGMLAGALVVAAGKNARPAALGAALIGAGLGLSSIPSLLSATGVEPFEAERVGRISPDLVPLGALLAGTGALLAVLTSKRAVAAQGVALLLIVGFELLPRVVPTEPAIPVAPWRKAPTPPRKIFETADGVFTLEGLRFGVESITLDRRVLSPGRARAAFDARRLAVSMQLCDPFKRARGEASVLLVGQLTPGRWLSLKDLGAGRIDRSGSWWRAMETLETAVFQNEERPPGEVVSPTVAAQRAGNGEYDVVIFPAQFGDQPRDPARMARGDWLRGTPPPNPLPTVVWLDARYALDATDLGDEVLLVPAGVAGLGVGVVANAPEELSRELLRVPVGAQTRMRSRLAALRTRDEERSYADLARFSERLLDAAPNETSRHLPEALVAYFGAQRRSSPYENPAHRVELPVEALDALLAHSLARPDGEPLDAFTRELWEEVSLVLAGKRWVPEILELLPPLLERYPRWPVVQRVVAQGLLESFETEEALAILLAHGPPADVMSWICLGEARRMQGDHAAATEAFREAYRLDPVNHGLQRALAIEAVLSGASDAAELLGEALEEHPEDEGLIPFQGPGPYPEPDSGFRPGLFGRTHHDH